MLSQATQFFDRGTVRTRVGNVVIAGGSATLKFLQCSTSDNAFSAFAISAFDSNASDQRSLATGLMMRILIGRG